MSKVEQDKTVLFCFCITKRTFLPTQITMIPPLFIVTLLSVAVLQGHGWQDMPDSSALRRRQMTLSSSVNVKQEYRVPLYLNLEYVGDELASAFEAADANDSIVSHLCGSIQHQVRN